MLRVEGLSAQYGNIPALHDVSLHVQEGELVTLIGANGAGKSTVLRAISGLLAPARGRITFEGNSIAAKRASVIVRAGVSHSPEGRQVFANMSVLENLQVGGHLLKASGMAASLEIVFAHFSKLSARRHQLAGSLSGGEQQMLAIGRALMSRPRLLLLDEPSLGLSPILVKEVVSIVKKLHAEGTAILLVEQNARLALRLADRGYVLENGRITLEGSGSTLLDDAHVARAYLGGRA